MKHKSWAVIGSCALIAVGFALYDFQSEKHEESQKAERAKLVPFNTDQINQVEILSSDVATAEKKGDPLLYNKIRLNRTVDGWKLEEPIQEMADVNTAGDFVEGIATETASDILMENEDIDWKVFGLDEPRGQVTVQNNLGEKIVLFISSKRNYQGEAFIRRDQEKKVFLASSNWFGRLEKKFFDFRDKRLLRRSMSGIQSLTFSKDGQKLQLNYQDSKWTAAGHDDWKLDQNKVRDVLGLFNNAVITEFVKESAPNAEDLKKYGLAKPLVSYTLKFKDASDFTADVGVDKDKYYYVATSEPAHVVKVATADSSRFLNVKLDILRDRTQPFTLVKADVKKVEVQGSEGTTKLEFDGKVWTATQKAYPELNVSTELAATLIDRVAELKVAEFKEQIKDVPEPKVRAVRFLNDKNDLMLELHLGPVMKKKIEGRDRALMAAKTNLYPEVFTLDETSARGLNLESFLMPAVIPPGKEKR